MAIIPTAKYSMLMEDVPTVVVNGATATGVAKSFIFSVQPSKSGQTPAVTLAVTGTFTVGTINLTASSDGTNYSAYSTADTGFDVNAKKFIQLTDLTPGLSYQISVATFTGTSVTISAVVS
jgi:hypothetical protein